MPTFMKQEIRLQLESTIIEGVLHIPRGDDEVVIELNQEAFEGLHCPKRLEIVPHTTHLFKEPGCLEEVTRLAADWFIQGLV